MPFCPLQRLDLLATHSQEPRKDPRFWIHPLHPLRRKRLYQRLHLESMLDHGVKVGVKRSMNVGSPQGSVEIPRNGKWCLNRDLAVVREPGCLRVTPVFRPKPRVRDRENEVTARLEQAVDRGQCST